MIAKPHFVITRGRYQGRFGYLDATDGVRARIQLDGSPADRFVSVKVADIEPDARLDPAAVWTDGVS